MPTNKPRERGIGLGNDGVEIVSKGGSLEGVQRLSKHEGGTQESPAESRVVGHEEFDKTKKLIEDKDMEKK